MASGTARGEDLFRYAEAYVRAGKPTEAWALVKNKPAQLCALSPQLAGAYHALGDQQSLENLLKEHPAATAAIGDLYAARGDWGRAITEYSRFITERTADGNLLNQRACAYAAAGQWAQARADWMRAIDNQPSLVPRVFIRLKQAERWGEAAEFGLKLVDQKPAETLVWLRVAPIFVLARDETGYKAFCDRMATQFKAVASPAVAEQLIKSCLLRASAIDLAKLRGDSLTRYLEKGEEPAYLRPHAGAALALLAYRGGNPRLAIKYATDSQKVNSRDFLRAVNLTVLAMAQHQLQHADLAHSALAEATNVTGRLPTAANLPSHHDTLIARILLREAQTLIDPELAGD